MNKIPSLKTCSVCNKLFENKTGVFVNVEMEDESGNVVATGQYLYCSEHCFTARIDTLGIGLPISERISLITKEQTSKIPNRWRVVCREIKLNIEMVVN